MRSVGLVTSARSDWGAQRPVAEALRAREDIELHIIAAGMHLAEGFGHTVDEIVADGFEVAHRLDFLDPQDTPEAIALSMGQGVRAFSRLFGEWRPDVLMVLGDRFDMFPAVVAATPLLIPVAHVHGGEVTTGAFDDALRHAMTKMSHLHFASTEECARRIRQMGENPAHVHVVGAPGLDDLLKLEPVGDEALRADFGFDGARANVLVVYHPETLAYRDVPRDIAEVLGALETVDGNLVIIRPNADTAHGAIQAAIDAFCEQHRQARAPQSLERRSYLSLMRAASVMVGNSSSGILEAPSFGLPVVNVGLRQAGRQQAANVIDCQPITGEVAAAIQKALSPAFAESLSGLENLYGDGHSAERIAHILATTPLTHELTSKRFVDR